jgi:hypothetical protein
MKNYRNNREIFGSIFEQAYKDPAELRGFILLMHIGAGPKRKEKFYDELRELLLLQEDYEFVTINELLK